MQTVQAILSKRHPFVGFFVAGLCLFALNAHAAGPKANRSKTKSAVNKDAPRASATRSLSTPSPTPSDLVTPMAKETTLSNSLGPARIEFDDRLIEGQRTQTGALYLFDRKDVGMLSLVKKRSSFRNLTLATVYGSDVQLDQTHTRTVISDDEEPSLPKQPSVSREPNTTRPVNRPRP